MLAYVLRQLEVCVSIRHLLLSSPLVSSVDVNGLTDLVLLCLDLKIPYLTLPYLKDVLSQDRSPN